MHSKEIEQLKRELAIERITVSNAVADLIQYTIDNKVCFTSVLFYYTLRPKSSKNSPR